MKRLPLVLSVLGALGSFALGHVYLERLEAETSGGPKIAVLVAAGDVPAGEALTEKRIRVRDIPQAYVEGRFIRAAELKKVLGARVAGGVRANEALLWTDLAKFQGEARVLSGLIQNGMRALSVGVRAADFDGQLRPGDRVDVLYSNGTKERDGATKTLLQNLLVLSVGGSSTPADGKGGLGLSGNVTLSVTMEQAQLLTQAEQRGRLTLTLRNPDDIALAQGLPETSEAELTRAREHNQDGQRSEGHARPAGIERVR